MMAFAPAADAICTIPLEGNHGLPGPGKAIFGYRFENGHSHEWPARITTRVPVPPTHRPDASSAVNQGTGPSLRTPALAAVRQVESAPIQFGSIKDIENRERSGW
jgi:hypothetical protein